MRPSLPSLPDEKDGTVLGTAGGIVGAVFLAFAGAGIVLVEGNPILVSIFTKMFIFALFALSLDFIFGHGGIPSFGHAAMFGGGGYTAAILMTNGIHNLLLVILISCIVSAAIAFVISALSVRSRGIYFAILTLVFSQVLYIFVFDDIPSVFMSADQILRGDNGIPGVPYFELFGQQLQLLQYYYLVLIALTLSFVIILRLINSPFGRVMQGIRENEERVISLGYDSTRYNIIGFTISGVFAGLAGALYVPLQHIAHPQLLHWSMSGNVLIWVLLGGLGTLWGPMLAAALVTYIENAFLSLEWWRLILSVGYILVIIAFPKGLAGAVRRVIDRIPGINDSD